MQQQFEDSAVNRVMTANDAIDAMMRLVSEHCVGDDVSRLDAAVLSESN